MNKLIELEKEARKAADAFMYAPKGMPLAPLYEAEQEAYKKLREYKTWLYKGSGVFGNEI